MGNWRRRHFGFQPANKKTPVKGPKSRVSFRSIDDKLYDSILTLRFECKTNALCDVSVKLKGKRLRKVPREKVMILYDATTLFKHDTDLAGSIDVHMDYFTVLQKMIMYEDLGGQRKPRLCVVLLNLLTFLAYAVDKVHPVIKYSSIAVQIKATLDRCIWATKEVIDHKLIPLKVWNFAISVLLDVILGTVCLSYLSTATSIEDFPRLFLSTAESIVTSLRNLLSWLAGTPAGFKLNHEFNNMLGKFFLFHTNVWWLFLAFISPSLGFAFQVFTVLGKCGLSLQAAILSDLLALVSFHIYCIYAYAARLYNIQLAGLVSLFRLFLGRKKNTLREKVDSCQYSADQQFVGTLLFAILLFLLPTTLLYYVVFTTSRLIILSVGGILSRTRAWLHAVPVCSFVLWLIGSSRVCNQIRISVENTPISEKSGFMVISVCGVPGTFKETVVKTIPDSVEMPAILPETYVGLLKQIIHGELLYPV